MSLLNTELSTATLQIVNPHSLARVGVCASRPRLRANASLPSRIGVVGNYLPRQCGIATFTTDLCNAIHAEYGATELLALPVNDTPEGYTYPARIRFELAQDEDRK